MGVTSPLDEKLRLSSSPPLHPFAPINGETLSSAQRRYTAENPTYKLTSSMDTLRRREFKRLRSCKAYLDYTGAGLYPECLVKDHAELMSKHIFGNPHSNSPSSVLSSEYAHAARVAVLNFFHADPSVYTVVFTPNATGALRLVGESYPFHNPTTNTSSCLILPVDAHNSVNGLREFAHAAGSTVHYVPMLMNGDGHEEMGGKILAEHDSTCSSCNRSEIEGSENKGLFVLTGQSNVSGRKSSLALLAQAKSQGFDTLLDAAALAPSTVVSLKALDNTVDAMALSLYKMIGYPTGLGCLVVKKSFLGKLVKPWFSGGTVIIVQAPGTGRLLMNNYERWEDGTINFLSLASVPKGLQILKGCMPLLTTRLPYIMHYCLSILASLKHGNGRPVVQLHSPASPDTYSPERHGSVIAISILRAEGDERVLPRDVEKAASKADIHVRAGCMCNPGATSTMVDLAPTLALFTLQRPESTGEDSIGERLESTSSDNEMDGDTASSPISSFSSSKVADYFSRTRDYLLRRHRRHNDDTPRGVREAYERNDVLEQTVAEVGVVRISFGLASSLSDATRLAEFLKQTYAEELVLPRNTKRNSMGSATNSELSNEEIALGSATGRRQSISSTSSKHWGSIRRLASWGRRTSI